MLKRKTENTFEASRTERTFESKISRRNLYGRGGSRMLVLVYCIKRVHLLKKKIQRHDFDFILSDFICRLDSI